MRARRPAVSPKLPLPFFTVRTRLQVAAERRRRERRALLLSAIAVALLAGWAAAAGHIPGVWP